MLQTVVQELFKISPTNLIKMLYDITTSVSLGAHICKVCAQAKDVMTSEFAKCKNLSGLREYATRVAFRSVESWPKCIYAPKVSIPQQENLSSVNSWVQFSVFLLLPDPLQVICFPSVYWHFNMLSVLCLPLR